MHLALELLAEIFAFGYCFLGLALICDGFLILSLETTCVRCKFREDVAGATLMAFGSAAPEIIVNMVATVRASTNVDSSNLGVGAIMGSGVIAFSVIPACCALVAAKPLHLKRRPLLRDVLTYAAALTVLCVMFADGEISLHESLSLLLLYAVYIVIIMLAPRARRWYFKHVLGTKLGKLRSFVEEREESEADSEGNEATATDPLIPNGNGHARYGSPNGNGAVASGQNGILQEEYSSDTEEESELIYGERRESLRTEGLSQDIISVYSESSRSFTGKVLFVLSWPLKTAFAFTCPPCYRGSSYELLYPITFCMSMGWVTLFSYGISHIVERWESLTRLKLSFLGFVLVASGAEIPDLIQSVTVARRGYGSMAVSNAIGSQIINICIGLGLPWTITILGGRDIVVTDHAEIFRFGLLQAVNVGVLSLVLLGTAIVLRQPKAILSKRKAVLFLCNYIAIVSAVSYFTLR